MTFTDEPSIIIPGRFSVRIEDIVVCEEDGGPDAEPLRPRPRRKRVSRRAGDAGPPCSVRYAYLGLTCVTSIEYTALNFAFVRSFVDTKTCVGCRSGKNGP